MSADQDIFDAIVVGAGPAGLSAALRMAQGGLNVVVVERGESAGSKNLGGLLYTTQLEKLLPGCQEKALREGALERAVSRRRIVYLGEERHMALDFGAEAWSGAPGNHTWTVHRPAFDRWFAKQAEDAGANLVEGMVVDELVYEGEGQARRAVGVRLRGDEEFRCRVVVLADGAHGLAGQAARKELGMTSPHPQHFALGVKEAIALPAQVIEDRFGLAPGQGAALDFIGEPFKGLIGGAFIYTQRETLNVGFAGRLDSLQKAGVEPGEVLDRFKRHPEIQRLLKGGELLEYGAHLIPEGGIDCVPQLTGNGVVVVGDAAGLVNMSLYKEGTNHAMESGRLAADAVIAASASGDFTRAGLASYEKAMAESLALQDLRKVRELPAVLEGAPGLLGEYPDRICHLLTDWFTITDEPKERMQKRAVKQALGGLSKLRLARDLYRARRLM